MSYARFGSQDSDVYVFLCVSGHLECCGCSLSDTWAYRSTDAMIAHLREHQRRGDVVPEHTFDGLEEDRAENEAYIAQEAKA